jgi:hypothetical protein
VAHGESEGETIGRADDKHMIAHLDLIRVANGAGDTPFGTVSSCKSATSAFVAEEMTRAVTIRPSENSTKTLSNGLDNVRGSQYLAII